MVEVFLEQRIILPLSLSGNAPSYLFSSAIPLKQYEKRVLKSALRVSNHPLSRTLYQTFSDVEVLQIDKYNEVIGRGIEVNYDNNSLKLGSSSFVKNQEQKSSFDTSVHISFNENYFGKFTYVLLVAGTMKVIYSEISFLLGK